MSNLGRLSNRIKEVQAQNNKVIVVDLEIIDPTLKGLVLPFKVKSFNEILRLKAGIKLPDIDIRDSIKVVPFRTLSEDTKRIYKAERPDLAYDSAMITIIDDEKNKDRFKKRKLENTILDCILHIDFNSKCDDENGNEITLWEDLGLEPGDYQNALSIFCEVINQEELVSFFEKLVDCLKNKMTDIDAIKQEMITFKFFYSLDKLPKDKQEEVLLSIEKQRAKLQDELATLSNRVKTEVKQIEEIKETIKPKKSKSTKKDPQQKEE